MRQIFLVIVFLVVSVCSYAQFESKLTVSLPDTLEYISLEWIDADNDGQLDVMVVAKGANEVYSILFYKNEKATAFSFASILNTEMTALAWHLTDADNDNQMDIMVSGMKGSDGLTSALLNKGNFQFEWASSSSVPKSASFLHLADLDLDGVKELILSGDDAGPFLNIYKRNNSVWDLVNDTLKVDATNIVTMDFDGDMDIDLFISGTGEGNVPFNAILFNRGDHWYTNPISAGSFFNAVSFVVDINHDGTFDLLISGEDNEGSEITRLMLSNGSGSFILKDTIMFAGKSGSLFAADLNSDGKIDVHSFGVENAVLFSDGNKFTLSEAGVITQKFGDTDRDGDLDIVQLLADSFEIFENTASSVNLPPDAPSNPLAVSIFDRLFLYWTKPGDDHTPFQSITYDITLQASGEELMVGDFDLIHYNRTLVSHGNSGANNFMLLRDIPIGPCNFYIQAVDNAYHAAAKSVCIGSVVPCSNLTVEEIKRCGSEDVPLTVGTQALWFSFAEGYLGMHDAYIYKHSSTDTLFAVIPGGESCEAVKVFTISHEDELVKNESMQKFVCENSPQTFSVEDGWESIEWSSSKGGFLSNDILVQITVTEADTLRVLLSDEAGCQLEREIILTISKPEITLPSETYQVLKGESVQLKAEGIGEFLWSPSTGLNNAATANPVSTPSATVEYTVTLTDSIGCSSQGKLLVIVEQTAFIPTLFTPNGDGKNDELRIYGLGPIQNFSFSIYNREGSLVFQTKDAQQATSNGWNGTSKGQLQPAGVYHWKVQGEYSGGRRLLINGKQSGSVVLAR